MRRRILLPSALLALSLSHTLAAQTHGRFSLQTSALYVHLGGDSAFSSTKSGPGAEAQLRLNINSISIGGGVQLSRHSSNGINGIEPNVPVTLLGVFFEPRLVLPGSSDVFAPYLAARVAYFQQRYSSYYVSATPGGTQFNAGGGVLVSATPRVNIDLGLTLGEMRLGAFHVPPAADGNGEHDVSAESGRNFVFRAGVAIGLGPGK